MKLSMTMRLLVAGALLLANICAVAEVTTARFELPVTVDQGGLVFGRTEPGSSIRYRDRNVRIAVDGSFLVGIGRDDTGSITLQARLPDGSTRSGSITIDGRKIITAPLSSYYKANQIANILKDWIESGKFLLGEPQQNLTPVSP